MFKAAKAFTLIELLVVISVISMLASVILTSLSAARMRGRDGVRTEEVHTYDTAIQMYEQDHNGAAPDLQSTCGPNVNLDLTSITNCVARSNDNSTAWTNFTKDIKTYLPSPPTDPCSGSSCAPGDTGYVYIAPAAMKFYCNMIYCQDFFTNSTEQHQIYATREYDQQRFGDKTSAADFYDPSDSYIELITRINGTAIQLSQNGGCAATIRSESPTHFANTSSCIQTMRLPHPGTYYVTWENNYPTGAKPISPTISPSQYVNSGSGVTVFYLDFQ